MDEHPKIQTANDGTLLLNFGQYGEEVEVAAISGDGQRVLTVRDVGVAEVWDAHSGDKVGEIRPSSPLQGTEGTAPMSGEFVVFVESAALNHDGSTALLGLNDGTAGTFRVSDGTRLATLHPPGEAPSTRWGVIRAVAYSPDGAFAVVGFRSRSVGVWSGQGDTLIAFLQATSASRLVGQPFVRDTLASSVAMSADARWVFAGNVDMTATIWELATGAVVFEARDHAEKIVSVFDNEEGVGWATTGGAVWRSRAQETPTKVLESGEHWAEVRFADAVFLTRGYDNTITGRNLSGGSELIYSAPDGERGLLDRAETLAFHDGWLLYPRGENRVGLRRGDEAVTIDHDSRLVKAQFAPGGDMVAIAGWRDYVQLWTTPGGELLHQLASPGGVCDFAFSPDGARVAIGETGHGGGRYTRHVFVYDVRSGAEVARHSEHDWQVSHVEISPDGRWLASLGDDIVVWDLERRVVLTRVDTDRVTTGIRFLSDGRLLVIDSGRARIFRDSKQLLEWEAPVGYGTRWSVSDDGRTLNIGMTQSVARFDLETGALRGTCAAAIPRPEYVPTAAINREIESRVGAALWRTEHGNFLHQSDGPRGWVQPLHLSPGGIVAVPTNNGAAILRIDPEVSMLGLVPFEGRLRASRVVDEHVMLVNERGQLFRQPIPVQSG